MSDKLRYWGGIEAGGTKFLCAIANDPHDVLDTCRIQTTTPEETLAEAVSFFQGHKEIELRSTGISCFGPLDLNPLSPTFGFITKTPKEGWSFTDMRIPFSTFGIPVQIDTDVNGAALGEHTWGAAIGLDTCLYLTIGTGIGGGGLANGELMHGLVHPEMGHVMIPHDFAADPFPGICPFHNDCFEGLASGPAIEKRWGAPGDQLPDDHPAWPLEAHYIALAVTNYILTLSPQRIILGGGVMNHPGLIAMVRENVRNNLNGYVNHLMVNENMDEYIVLPELGNRAGIMGAIALARQIAD